MVFVRLLYDKDHNLRGYNLIGHAGLAEEGNDILCAALSAIAVNTGNAIEKLSQTEVQTIVNEEEPLVDVRTRGPVDEKAAVLLKTMEMFCEDLEKDKRYEPYYSLTREEIEIS